LIASINASDTGFSQLGHFAMGVTLMLSGKLGKSLWLKVLRGVAGSVLLFAVYIISGSILSGIIAGLGASEPSAFIDLLRGACASFLSAAFASYVVKTRMKNYPARAVVVAFVGWLAGNYFVHFVFFSELTDFDTYYGLISSSVGCATVIALFWQEIRPGRPPQSN
jgi:hypothetical protein